MSSLLLEESRSVQTLKIGSKTLDEPKTEKIIPPNTQMQKERYESSSTRYQPRRKGANLKKGGSCKFAEATMAVQFPQEERDVHEEVGGGGHPLAHLYLHHPALRDAGAQPLHWRLRLVACHQVVKMKKQLSLNFYVNVR